MINRESPYNDLPLVPPDIDLENTALLKKAIVANRHLAELKGSVLSIPNQDILVNSIVLQEARISSEIENIVTTSDELYRAVTDEKLSKDPHAKEILRYRQALNHALSELEKRPLSTNVFVEIVSTILDKKVNVRNFPGTKIQDQKTKNIVYTPPEGESVIRDKLSNLEKFIHDKDDGIDPLIKLAIMHYQFEAIHPFSDGNGRTGRIINILYLLDNKLLDKPVLFLSSYILRKKSDYYKLLRGVTEHSSWYAWIEYMLDAVSVTAKETQERVKNILSAMDDAIETIQSGAPKIYSKDLVDVIFMHPYSKVSFLERAGIAKRQTAAVYLKELESLGLLSSEKIGREQYYINKRLVEILSQ